MTNDLNKGISAIAYNSLNLPRQMVINSASAKAKNYYTYSASGVKLKTEQRYDPALLNSPIGTTTPATDGLTDYKNTDYTGNIIYETMKSGSTTTNKTRILVDGGYIENNAYYFYLNDHLGNNRVVANASGTVTQKNHYYPFGTTFAESTSADAQPYKYNGKELDKMHGLNLYDYSARYYESAIGRFTTIDPLAEKYYSISPYVYCANNPINVIDPFGTDTININAKGRLMSHIKSKESTVFNIIDKDGNTRSLSMEYSPIVVTKGKIDGQEYEAYTLLGDEIGTKAFEFLSQNLGITKEYGGMGEIGADIMEWSLSRFGKEGSTGINVLSTGFKRNQDPSAWKIIEENSSYGFFLRGHSHSHPYGGAGDAIFEPSGLPGTRYFREGRGDIPFAKGVVTNRNFKTNNTKFSVYSGYFKKYINYNQNGIIK